ncbi:MAG: hypothetical protein WC716_04575 [Chitinophagaceae bacterium]|jgi:hypothetical protein
MSKIKLLSLIALILLLCNLVLIWQMFNNESGKRGEGPRMEIIARLNFDDKQVEQYDILVHQHHSQINMKEDEIRSLKKALYQTLLSDSSSRDSLILLIADQQKDVEHINLQHFADIGRLCRPDQKDRYKVLVGDLSELFMHKKPPPRRH